MKKWFFHCPICKKFVQKDNNRTLIVDEYVIQCYHTSCINKEKSEGISENETSERQKVIIYAGIRSTTYDEEADQLKNLLEEKMNYEIIGIIPMRRKEKKEK